MNKGFMVLYGLAFFFANFGPNTTTFIVPAELFPARFRSTCHGISGAVGKVGAIIGSVGFLWASHRKKEDGYPKGIGMKVSLIILGGVCLLGMVITYFSFLNFFTLNFSQYFSVNIFYLILSLLSLRKAYKSIQV